MMHKISLLVFCLSVSSLVHAQDTRLIRKNPEPKLESRIEQLLAAHESGRQDALARYRSRNLLATTQTIPVSIRTTNTSTVDALLRSRGATVANSLDDTIEAYVRSKYLRDLSHAPEVVSVKEIARPEPLLIGQGVVLHNAYNWQSFSYNGSGVRIGIIDDFEGITALLGTELPATLVGRCYSSIGVYSSNVSACDLFALSNHGTAVAEAVHDIAPAAQMYIANPISNEDLRQTVDWMTSQGVRIINLSSHREWDGPGDGTSPFSASPLKSVDSAVSAGALFVAAAGNHAQATWSGPYTDANGNGWAEFAGALDHNRLTLAAGETIKVQLRWEDSWGGATRDLDLVLTNANLTIVSESSGVQAGGLAHDPYEVLTYTATVAGQYYIGVTRFAGTLPAWLQVQAYGGNQLNF